MKCNTVKIGKECAFMIKNGCSFTAGKCSPIIEKCIGCNNIQKINDIEYCVSYPDPSLIWKMECPKASHIVAERLKKIKVQKINPLKASKRAKKKLSK